MQHRMQSLTILEDPMTVGWDDVTRAEVVRAIQEYDRLGPEEFFSEHGFAPTTTYYLVWDETRYPPKAILGTAYELGAALLRVAERAGCGLVGGRGSEQEG